MGKIIIIDNVDIFFYYYYYYYKEKGHIIKIQDNLASREYLLGQQDRLEKPYFPV